MGTGWPVLGRRHAVGLGETDDAESLRALHAALDAGITLFDTADAYGTGHAERLLARVVAGRRDQVVIASKWGNTLAEEQRQLTGVDASPGVRTARGTTASTPARRPTPPDRGAARLAPHG